MRYKNFTFILLGLFLLSSVSASTICTLSQQIIEVTEGEVPQSISFTCFNNAPLLTTLTAVTTTTTDLFSLSNNIIGANTTSSSQISSEINFNSMPIGEHLGYIWFDDGTMPINIKLIVNANTQSSGDCYLYTKKYLKSLKINQEEIKNDIATVRVIASEGCPDLTFDDVVLTYTDAIEGKPLGLNVGWLEVEGKEYNFNLDANAEGVGRGVYHYTYSVSIDGRPELDKDVDFTIEVYAGDVINPNIGNITSNLPTCSLSASEFALNQTYKLICNSINSNIQIQPIIEYDYIKGVGVSETGDSYEYSFQPIDFGNTIIKARFLFKNAPIGNEYSQEVRILASSGVVPGTSLALRFYPPLYEAQENSPITIRAVDNETGNILTNAVIYLDGIELLNDSLILKSNKNYEVRVSHLGYSDLVEDINLNPKLINFTLKSEYNLGESLNFTTDIEGATVSLNGELISLPFILNSLGTFEISVSKLGYTTSSQNITIGSISRIIYSTPLTELKKGGDVLIEFEKNDTKIYVDFQADTTKPAVILISEFTGKEVRFKTEETGVYHVYADGEFIHQFVIESNDWYKSYWLWIPLGLACVGLFLYYGLKEDEDELPLSE